MLKALRRRDAALVDASGFGGFIAVRGIRRATPSPSVCHWLGEHGAIFRGSNAASRRRSRAPQTRTGRTDAARISDVNENRPVSSRFREALRLFSCPKEHYHLSSSE
jgi:hypothetical protein